MHFIGALFAPLFLYISGLIFWGENWVFVTIGSNEMTSIHRKLPLHTNTNTNTNTLGPLTCLKLFIHMLPVAEVNDLKYVKKYHNTKYGV
jgi:hypothetical protein